MKQRYDSYKPSGVEWIGEIPSHWNVVRMRYLCDMITGDKDTVNRVDDGIYPFYVRSPHIERINSYTFDGEAVLMAGDGVAPVKFCIMLMVNLTFIREFIISIISDRLKVFFCISI